jgi:hypothetical protein
LSNTYRDAAPQVRARRNVARDDDGAPRLPRIVLRRPRRGDIHPLSPARIRELLRALPVEQIYKLERIELRPRTCDIVGFPFAEYFGPERMIVLYSLPTGEYDWFYWLARKQEVQRILKLPDYARYRQTRYGVSVHWDEPGSLARWLEEDVLMHELGHHWRNVYEATWPRWRRRRDEERVAEARARRAVQRRLKR